MGAALMVYSYALKIDTQETALEENAFYNGLAEIESTPVTAPKPSEDPDNPANQVNTDTIVGDFIINGYENNKNDWHFVKISVLDKEAGTFQWTNKAGVKWTLTKTDSPNKLTVGEDCPYYSSGYTEAELKFAEGKVVAIAGPWNEIYTKQKAVEAVKAAVAGSTDTSKPAAEKAKDCAKLKAAADACKANQEKAKEDEENKKEQEKDKEADKGKKEEEKAKKDKDAKDKTKEEEKKKEENKDDEEKKTNDKKKKETDDANKKKKEDEKETKKTQEENEKKQ